MGIFTFPIKANNRGDSFLSLDSIVNIKLNPHFLLILCPNNDTFFTFFLNNIIRRHIKRQWCFVHIDITSSSYFILSLDLYQLDTNFAIKSKESCGKLCPK